MSKVRPKYKEITLELIPESKELIKGFMYQEAGHNKNLYVELNGKYNNKTIIANFSNYNWKSTQTNLEDALKAKGIAQKDVDIVMEVLDRNGKSLIHDLQSDEEEDEEDSHKRASDKLLELIEPLINSLFQDDLETAYATIQVNNHLDTVNIASKKFEKWIAGMYYLQTNKTVGNDVIKEVVSNLESRAMFGGNEQRNLHLRIARDPDDRFTFYYDLANTKREVIKITKDGWSIKKSEDVPTLFKRYSVTGAQVYPANSWSYSDANATLDEFLDLLNIENNKSMRLVVKCRLVSLFVPVISKPASYTHGPHGACKTSNNELEKELVDPSPIRTLSLPKDQDRFLQHVNHSYTIYYDNVSYLKPWFSDTLCRVITGTADLKRSLYTNEDDFVYCMKRCIGLNGINMVVRKADLLDRLILVKINIPKKRLEHDSELIPKFNELKPKLLACIFDTLVKVLKMSSEGGIQIEDKTRMADFEKYGEMISRCLGNEPNSFCDAYRENRKLATDAVLEGNVVAKTVISLITKNANWSGYADELLLELKNEAIRLSINFEKDRSWPKTASYLSFRLNEIEVELSNAGITYTTKQDVVSRRVTFTFSKSTEDKPEDEYEDEEKDKNTEK